MSKKKILIVSRSFYPMNSPRSFRTTELAKEFSRQGQKVTVITPKDKSIHPRFEKEYGITIKDLGQLKWKAVTLKGNGVEMLGRRMIRRLSDYLFQYPGIELMQKVGKALSKEKDYDLLISIAAPHTVHWGVAKAWNDQGVAKTWIADCGDPFMGLENDTFTPPFYFKFVEKWFCQKANFITVPTEGALQGYYPEFHHKIKVIPQGFKFEDVKVADEKGPHSKPTFAYAGGFIPGRRDPSELLEYLGNLKQDFEFHIYTGTPTLVKPFLHNDRVLLHKPIPRNQLLYELSKMDFVVNFENVGIKQTPSKLIDYAIIQRPILSVKTNGLRRCLVNEFLSGQYTNQLQVNGVEQYRIETVCQQFLALVNA